MKRPEQIIQTGVFSELIPLMYLQNYEQFIAFQIRNETGVGGEQGGLLGSVAKAMGTMAGVSDTAFLFPQRVIQAVNFEKGVKVSQGMIYPTKDQKIPPKIVFTEFKALKPLKTKEVDPINLLDIDQLKFKERVEKMGFEYKIIAAQSIADGLKQVKEFLRENHVKI